MFPVWECDGCGANRFAPEEHVLPSDWETVQWKQYCPKCLSQPIQLELFQ